MSEDNDTRVYQCDYNPLMVTTHRIYLFVIGPILVLGLVLNTLNVVVLHRVRSSSNAFFMLQFMALSDILYLLACLIYFPIRRLIAQAEDGDDVYTRGDWVIRPEILIVIDPVYHMLLVSRNWIVVVITVERLLNILVPFWARRAITRFRLKIVILVIYVLAVALYMRLWFMWSLVPGVNECSGKEALYIHVSSRWLSLVSNNYIYVIMTVTAPMCCIYIANVMLVVGLRRSFLERAKMAGDNKDAVQQRQAIVIVMAMSMVFTVFETPACLDRFIYFATGSRTELTRLLRRGALILNITDSTVNFFAYCASSRPFRDSLRSSFGRKMEKLTARTNVNDGKR